MCVYCDKVVNANLKEIKQPYIEDTICESDQFGTHRQFMISKYKNGKYTLDYESDHEAFSMEIRYCPMCGRKLE